MPRVEELIIITEYSPWCTIIKNPNGVNLGDICTTLFQECVVAVLDICAATDRLTPHSRCSYTDKNVTTKEFESLPPRLQEQVRRYATSASSANAGWQQYYTPQVAPTSFRRVGEYLRRGLVTTSSRTDLQTGCVSVSSSTS